MKRFDTCWEFVDAWVEAGWYRLVLIFKLSVLLGVVVGCAYVAVEGLPFGEWVRVEIVIGLE